MVLAIQMPIPFAAPNRIALARGLSEGREERASMDGKWSRLGAGWLSLILAVCALGVQPTRSAGQDKQAVLGPGLYVFQTRTREATCGDAEPDGYVLSFMAAIDGVPGAISMSMQLVNTKHFNSWTLKVMPNGHIVGDSKIGSAADAPDSHFEVVLDGPRFKGTGYRSFNGTAGGKPTRCKVSYDALLRRIDI
jgi:hypothetical protein